MAISAYEYSLNLLSARAYTERNLRRKLVQKKFDLPEIENAVERLLASKLVDDERFAAEYARQKLVGGGVSSRRVQQDLVRKGIASDVSTRSVVSVAEEESVDSYVAAERAARKKLKSLTGLESGVQRRRLFTFLARRGFELDDVKRAMSVVLSNTDPE